MSCYTAWLADWHNSGVPCQPAGQPTHPPTGGVDFEVMAVCGVQAQQAAAGRGRVHDVAEQVAQCLSLRQAGRGGGGCGGYAQAASEPA